MLNTLASTRESYRFGGSCLSQGQWVQEALNQAAIIKSVIQQLKSDENCSLIVQTLNALQLPPYQSSKELEDQAQMTKELNLIMGMTKLQLDNNDFFNLLLGKSIDNAILSQGSRKDLLDNQRTKKLEAANFGLTMLSSLLGAFPQSEQCLFNNANSAVALLSGSVKMISAYSGGNDNFLTGINKVITDLVEFLQNKTFSKIFKNIEVLELWSSISCLIESTTENYCAAIDANEMLAYSNSSKLTSLRKNFDSGMAPYNPMEGYLIYTREVELVTSWLRKIQFGVRPRLVTDAKYKNTILENVTEMLQFNFNLMAFISDREITYRTLSNLQAKKGYLLETIKGARNMIMGGSFMGGANSTIRGEINFYTINIIPGLIPFYIIGINEIPREVASNTEGKFVMRWDDYLENGGKFQPQFDDPDSLLVTIRERTDELIRLANLAGSEYFRQRFIVDLGNLVDESLTGTGLTVKKSLYRTKRYLERLFKKYSESHYASDPEILPNMAITIEKIDVILRKIDKIKSFGEEQLKKIHSNQPAPLVSKIILNELQKGNFEHKYTWAKEDELVKMNFHHLAAIKVMVDDKNQEEITNLYENVIDTVYNEFNILLQRESFLQTRMSTFVRYDYSYITRNRINLTPYQTELLTVATQGILSEFLYSTYRNNPSLIKQELAQSQLINQNNIASVERLFSNSLVSIIRELNLIAKGQSHSDLNLNIRSFTAFLEDSKNFFLSLGPALYNIFSRSDRYPIKFDIDFDKVLLSEDSYGSIEQFKSRLCIQTLAFNDKEKFYDLCQGSVLRSYGDQIDFNGSPLSSSYDRLLYTYLKENKSKNNLTCAFRNFRRRNQAYWILNNINERYE